MPTEFESRVYAALRKVPKGKVVTYADLAKAVACAGGARAVGNAMNKNPYAPEVPCHRVVRSDGRIGGFAHGEKKKALMLESEGLEIKDGRIVEFDKRVYCF